MSRRRPAWLLSSVGFTAALLVVASGHVPTAKGQPKPLVVPPAPQAPTLTTPASLGVKRGTATELTLAGTNLADATAVIYSGPGTATIPTDNKNGSEAAKLRVKVDVPADAPVGLYTIRVATRHGVSNLRPFVVDELTGVVEVDNNRTKDTAQPIEAPCSVSGRADPEASDYFRVKVAAGQRLTFEVLARRIGSPLDPIVVLHDAKTKRELVDLYADDTPGLQGDARLTHTFKDASEILVEVRDTTYRGGADYAYRLRVGEFPGATTAFPLAVQRGQEAKVGFAGPGAESIAPVAVRAPTDPTLVAVYAAPKFASGPSGWPLPVRLSDSPELTEQEPNDDTGKANKLPVPGGVSGRFGAKGDTDHYKITAAKGQKLTIAALTYEVNAPTEVLIRVLDGKGAELARSNPQQPAARVEFTPPADGEFVVACEHLNYLFGPNEVYHLSVRPATPDFDVALALDRYEAPAGGGTGVAVTNIARLNGYAGPVELSVVGNDNLSGKLIVPAGQTQAFVPLMVKAGAKPGAYPFRVQAKATIDGKDVVRFAALTDVVKTSMGGIPNPPPELLTGCAVAVIEKPSFSVKLTPDPTGAEKGKPGKVVVEVTRDGADAEIVLAPLFGPPNLTPAVKPIPKGQSKAEFPVTVAPNAPVGLNPLVLRATTKIGGKDYVVTPPPAVFDVAEPKKTEPKKDEPKKDKK